MSDEVKGTVFREKRMGDHKPAYDEQMTNFCPLISEKKPKKLTTNFGTK
jgi:hypothetical protein